MPLLYKFHWPVAFFFQDSSLSESVKRLAPNYRLDTDECPIDFQVTDNSMATLDRYGIFKNDVVTGVSINNADLLPLNRYAVKDTSGVCFILNFVEAADNVFTFKDKANIYSFTNDEIAQLYAIVRITRSTRN